MSAAIVYIHPGDVKASFSYSLLRLFVYEIGRTKTVPVVVAQYCASGQLVEARNETAAYFLDHTDAEWCLFVDSDMGFAPDTLEQLLGSADASERPVVGALCFGLKKSGDDPTLQASYLRAFPTIYFLGTLGGEVGFREMTDYPPDAMVECHATGAACFVTHRTILERMRAHYGDEWFTKATLANPDGTPRHFSEDLSFFLRLHEMNVPVFVNTGVQTSHDKGAVCLTEETYLAQQATKSLATELAQAPDPLELDAWVQQPA